LAYDLEELAAETGQRKVEAACSACEENRELPQKALFAFRGDSSFSQPASRWNWTKKSGSDSSAPGTSHKKTAFLLNQKGSFLYL
jgi:hypothetical protein